MRNTRISERNTVSFFREEGQGERRAAEGGEEEERSSKRRDGGGGSRTVSVW